MSRSGAVLIDLIIISSCLLMSSPVSAQDTGSAAYRHALGQYRQGDLDAAITGFTRIIEAGLSDAAATGQGAARSPGDNLILHYEDEIVIVPCVAAAYYVRGLAHYRRRDFRLAANDFNAATGMVAHYADAWTNLSAALFALGELQAAQAAADRSISIRPRNAAAYHNRGLVWYQRNDYDRAIADFNQALAFNPKSALTWLNRGNAWFSKHAWDKALADYNQALKLNPQLAAAYNNRGNAEFHRHELEAALRDYNEALQLNPRFAEAWFNRGLAFVYLGHERDAAADFNQCRELDARLGAMIEQRADKIRIRRERNTDHSAASYKKSDENSSGIRNPE